MSEEILLRKTYCETGRLADERFWELVCEMDDGLHIKDPTPRIANVTRIYTRGDMGVLARHQISWLEYRIGPIIIRVEGQHVEVPLALAGLTIRLYLDDNPRRPGQKKGFSPQWAGSLIEEASVKKVP